MTELMTIEEKRARLVELIEKRNKVKALLGARNQTLENKLNDPNSPVDDYGVPLMVRMAVDNARTPQDKLATLRKFYKMAIPVQDWSYVDPKTGVKMRSGEGDNFVVIDPESGKKIVYNKPGIDWGDIAGEGRLLSRLAGGALGARGGPLGMAAVGTAAGALYDVAAQRAGQVETRPDEDRVKENLFEFGIDAAGGAALPMVSNIARKAMVRPGAGDVFNAAQRADVRLTPGDIGNEFTRSLQKTQRSIPGSAGIVEKAEQRSVQQTGEYLEGVAQRTGRLPKGVSPAGQTMQEAAGTRPYRYFAGEGDASFRSLFEDRSGALFQQVDQFWAPNETIAMTRTSAIAQDITKRFGRLPKTAKRELPKEVQDTLDDLAAVNNAPTWFEADALRKAIGARISDGSGAQEATNRQLKALYAIITEDMEHAVKSKGGRAAELWDRGKAHRRSFEERATLLKTLTNSDDPVQAYKTISNQSAPQLRATKRSILSSPDGAQTWNDVAAAKMMEMGRVTPGQPTDELIKQGLDEGAIAFSSNRMAMNYEKMRQAGTNKIWFTGEQRAAMLDIFTLANAQRLLGSAENTSRTAKMSVLQNIILYGMKASGVGIGVSTSVAAFAIYNPAFVRWMAQGLSKRGKAQAAHMGRLVALAKADPALQPVAADYLQKWNELGGGPIQAPSRRKALYSSRYLGTENMQGMFQ